MKVYVVNEVVNWCVDYEGSGECTTTLTVYKDFESAFNYIKNKYTLENEESYSPKSKCRDDTEETNSWIFETDYKYETVIELQTMDVIIYEFEVKD